MLVIAPFFVTYLIRTLAWQTILADDGVVAGALRSIGVLGPTRMDYSQALATVAVVGRRLGDRLTEG